MKTSVRTILTAIAVLSCVRAQEVDDTFNAASVRPAPTSEIVCDGIVTCESTYDPVCTSLGRTYANACQFKNAYCEHPSESFYIVSKGPCRDDVLHVQSVEDEANAAVAMPASVFDVPVELDDPASSTPSPLSADDCDGVVACDSTYEPVCTSKGRTYRNACEFKNAYCEKPSEDFYIVPCTNDPLIQVQSVDDDDGKTIVTNEVLNAPVEIDDVTNASVQELDAHGTENPEEPAVTMRPPIDCSSGDLRCDVPDDPVCASNGNTYINACQFKNAYCEHPNDSFYIVGKGPCDRSLLQVQSVSDEEREIWGTVFDVPVELDESTRIPQPSADACDGRIECNDAYDPVCASDGSTFRNDCEFKNAFCENPSSGVYIVSEGPCDSSSSFRVQSASDGVSADVLNVPIELDEVTGDADVKNDVYRSRPPKLSAYCTLICPTGNVQVAPLCGTDSRSYINDCHLLATKCEQPDLEKQYDGLCVMGQPPVAVAAPGPGAPLISTQEAPPKPKCNAFCGRRYDPVCGSNGVTYANQCLLDFAHCQNPRVTKLSDGKCTEINSASVSEGHDSKVGCVQSVCPGTEALVCGSDGQTYLNVCMLNNARCLVPGISVVHDGECGPETVLTCANRTCPRYSECREDPATHVAYCADVCHADRCGPHETCKLLPTTDCFSAPCAPVATCVPIGSAYADDY